MTIPEGAALILFDDQGRIALQLRDDIPDTWGLFGGWSEPGESPVETARRELAEELSICLPPERFHFVGSYAQPGHFLAHVFRANIEHESPQAVLGEGADWEFFSLDAIAQLRMMPGDPEMLHLYGSLC